MKVVKRFCLLMAAALVLIGSYLFFSIQIFNPPKIVFSSKTDAFFQKDNDLCAKNMRSPSPISQTHFRLLVWNMHKGADQGWQQDLRRFTQQADFLLLQEVTNQQQLPQLLRDFPTSLYSSAFSYLGVQSGVSMLAKAEPDLYCAGAVSEPWIRIPKVANALRFPLANQQSLLIVNVHLVNFELGVTHYRQQLEMMLKLIAQHQGPVILAGDFNTWRAERLALVRELAHQYQLQEVTFQPDIRRRVLQHPLDLAFVRGLTVNHATTVAVQSSDHNPLLFDLSFIPNQP